MARLTGTLERITYQSGDDGYTVARLRPHGKSFFVTVVGTLTGACVGETLDLDGEWTTHPVHGTQFQVARFQTLLPASIDGIRRYLASGLIKGIGPATARRIVDHFGADTLTIIDQHPELLDRVPGLSRARAEAIRAAWQSQRHIKALLVFLQEQQLPPELAIRLFRQYGDQALETLRTRPYRLAAEVAGIGFHTADQIGAALGIAADDPARIRAGLRAALGEASNDGHCFLPADELASRAARLLDVAPTLVADAIAAADDQDELAVEYRRVGAEGVPVVLLRALQYAEIGVAAGLAALRRAPSAIAAFFAQASWERVFAHLAGKHGIQLTERQQAAIVTALTSKVSILTGGPGTGKTTTLRTLVGLLRARGYRVLLASPTGRAARRLAEATSYPASTIHRLLDYAVQGGGSFRRNAASPLEADLVVVDEASMLDVLLANHLLKAIPPPAHLLLVGDADQLPSVGPGRVLHDLLESGSVPVVRLDVVFRQAEGSGIVAAAHRINQGELPEMRRGASGRDEVYFIAAPGGAACAAMTVELVAERLPRRFGLDPRTAIQVLSPTHRGDAGVASLNAALQQALNPPHPAIPERRLGGGVVRVGDRVMQMRNNYDLDVSNGDVGQVEAIDPYEGLVVVRYEGGRSVTYPGGVQDELMLAYASSVHKAQGGEFPAVVITLLPEHGPLLQRNLLYTAITRARQLVVLVGDWRALVQAVGNNRPADRYTALKERIA